MGQREVLPEELRRGVYAFVLSIYETFERLPFQSVLARDIESRANHLLILAARYPVFPKKSELVSDISAALKGLRALLGVSRDTSLLERGQARGLLEKCEAVDLAFEELLDHATAARYQPAKLPESRNSTNIAAESIGQKKSENRISPSPDVSLRQKAILEVLKRRDRTTIGELGMLFSGRVSKKTLQRDLQELVRQNIVQREGNRRWTSYFLV